MTTSVRTADSPKRTADGPLSKLQLWEYGRRRLGYGEWTPEHRDPWLKYAGLEGHKLYLSMNKRRATQAEFMLCVDYCHRHRIRIENAVWVFRYYDDARAEQRELMSAQGLPKLIEEAVAYEHSLAAEDSPPWIAKLTRAAGKYREEVLAEWRLARKQSVPSAINH